MCPPAALTAGFTERIFTQYILDPSQFPPVAVLAITPQGPSPRSLKLIVLLIVPLKLLPLFFQKKNDRRLDRIFPFFFWVLVSILVTSLGLRGTPEASFRVPSDD